MPILVPSTHFLLSVVAVRVKSDPTDQCLRYLVVLFRHRPENSVVHSLIVNGDYFGLAAQRLHRQELWPEVYWSDKGQIDKLYDYLSIIIKETRRDFPLEVPKLVSAVDTGSHTTCIYSAYILGEKFFLSPIFTGRGNSSRKAFVTIAHKEGSNDDKRIFKYSWHKGIQIGKESGILKDLKGTPGVVQIDEDLSNDSIETDPNSGRTRTLVVLRTVGQSLGSCRTVQEFL